ncbi:MAG: putative Histidine kinase [Promethearchaeota archaeon]|nr:MAG: putative Histidine kinase [Candidatus Lokiarchaeota archaeon]
MQDNRDWRVVAGKLLNYKKVSIIFSIVILLYILNYINQPLFHIIVEFFAILIFGGIFIIGWNSRKYRQDSFFLILGISSLFIAYLDFLHTISYPGLSVIPGSTLNMSVQFWIVARYLQAASILFAFIMMNKQINPTVMLGGFFGLSVGLSLLIFIGMFPITYIEGVGLTPFKVISEYLICGLIAISILMVYLRREAIDYYISILITVSFVFLIFSEINFTLYFDRLDFSVVLGHILKIISSFFLYLAIFENGIANPFDTLFKKLKTHEKDLEDKNKSLEEFNRILYEEIKTRRKIEKKLKHERNNMINIMETITDKLYVVDKNYEIQYANPSLVNEYGPVENKKCYQYLFDMENPCKHCHLHKVIDGKTYIYEINQNKRIDHYSEKQFTSSDGKICSMVIKKDITSVKKAEEKLKQFISMLSHELRTPITVIEQSLSNIISLEKELNKNDMQNLKKITLKNARILEELIEDLTIISKLEEQRYTLEKRRVNASLLLEEVLGTLESKRKGKNLTFDVEIEEEIALFCDPIKIKQVFRILTDNAIKYSKNGEVIKIKAENNYTSNNGSKRQIGVLFKFEDNGIGIPEHETPYIFNRFYRSSISKNIEGIGLGLSIAKDLINLHDGFINVESDLGKGSIFSVFLPK